jgi:hypothetical protein
MALFGVYWDDAWHTDRGRDDLFSPPHLSLYAGVAVVVAVVIWWAWQRRGDRALASGPVGLAVTGAMFTLASAPVDEWWHQAFGRDAVLWSPPHLAAVAGTIALGTGVAFIATPRSGVGDTLVGGAAGAAVIGAWQVLVLEYDTDVAQFSPLWYLPVMASGLAAAAITVQAAGSHRARWPATWAGVVFTLAMAGVYLGLDSAGYSTPIVPLVLPALAVADLSRRMHWVMPLRAIGFVGALFASYWPYLGAVPGGVQPTLGDAAGGALLAAVGVAAVLVVMDPSASFRMSRAPVAALMALAGVVITLTVGPPRAEAHDPGQGDEITDVTLIAEVTDRAFSIEVVFAGDGDAGEPVRVVARRAGRTLTGPLAATPNGWSGWVDVDEDGRWFVYVEARRGQQDVEAWMPVVAGSTGTASKETAIYVADADGGVSTAQAIAGIVLLAFTSALFGRIAVVVRATLPARAAAAGSR